MFALLSELVHFTPYVDFPHSWSNFYIEKKNNHISISLESAKKPFQILYFSGFSWIEWNLFEILVKLPGTAIEKFIHKF